ncbi:MAG: peptide-methionine (S)-S-oxide reductase MsrA [Rhodospirillaceae bacterium]|nr:MAG: peptide-methionine (S)-S-oxide reductase MsrA [Rhodospirillaceae bacterium]
MKTTPIRKARRFLTQTPLLVAVAATLMLAAAGGFGISPSAADESRILPAPAVDETSTTAKTETAVLAGGCFWGVQGVFQHVKGVSNAVSGYAGGDADTANYDTISEGDTGHAESVAITYDPAQISYGRLLQIFFSVAHDPTQLNRQGPDHGTNYRSAIFPASPDQARIAKAYIAQLNQAHVYDAAIVTTIEPDRAFYPAEAYHQDFLVRNPSYPYIVFNDLPKVENLKRLFPDLYRDNPVLVSAAATN